MVQNGQKRILVVDDEENILQFMSRALQKKGYEVHAFQRAQEGLERLAGIRPDLVITDMIMPEIGGIDLLGRIKNLDPEINVILMTAHASLETAISAMRGGAADYLIKPFKVDELCTVVNRALSTKRLLPEASDKVKEFKRKYDYRNLIGSSEKMKEIFKIIERVAETEATVLVTGESGTGKELVARSIHYNSKRKDRAFVSINCAALPETLLESELFGYEKGSFTGALATKMGLLEHANEGTFFFDEVAEIPMHLQAKLLRVLQEREIRHLGGLHDIKINVRILAATSKDLKVAVQQGTFREDLWYRLNVVQIHMPPLRERREDIPLLVSHFLDYYNQKLALPGKVEIDPAALSYLKEEYAWPGNIRELENMIERMMVLSDSGRITKEQILKLQEKGIESRVSSGEAGALAGLDLKSETELFERRLIESVLKETNGNKFQAAKRLKISRQSLQYKLKKYSLD